MPGSARRLTPAGSAAELDAFVLCGGLGTRLRPSLPHGPKALVPVAGRPFLALLLAALARAGVRRAVLCTGHAGDAIEAALPELAQSFTARPGEAPGELALSREPRPLGTGGALAHALPCARRDPLLVLNGDSLCALDPGAMLARHRASGAQLTLGAVRGARRPDTGALRVDASGRVLEFCEKGPLAGELASAGVYLLESSALAGWPAEFSLERELFPKLAAGAAQMFELGGPLVDIGTPERLRAAPAALARLVPAQD